MSGLEATLRNALQKGNAADPAFRERVYGAAVSAMQRSAAARGASVDAQRAQARALEDAIRRVEAEYQSPSPKMEPRQRPASDPAPKIAPEPGFSRDVPPVGGNNVRPAEPGLRAEPRPEVRAKPKSGRRNAPVNASEKPVGTVFRLRRGPFAAMFSVVVLIALFVAGLWWVITSGAFVSEADRDTSVANPPVRLEGEDFTALDPGTATAPVRRAADTEAATQDGWVVLFTPADPTTLGLQGGATASIETDPFGNFARIVTPSPEGVVLVDVPPGTLQMHVGKPVQLSLVMRTEEGQSTQVAVTCDFGPMGGCGRRRFNVGQADQEYLIEIMLPDVLPPATGGVIALRADIENGQAPVKLLSVRLRGVEG